MKPITISRIFHRQEERLSLVFDYDEELIEKIKNIPGRKWSKTMKCWHVPYREDYLKHFQCVLGEIRLKDTGSNIIEKPQEIKIVREQSINIRHNKEDNLLYIKVPFALKDKIKKLDGAQWHSKSKLWIAYANDENFEQIKESFSGTEIEVTITESGFTLKNTKKDTYKDLEKLSEQHKIEIEQFKKWMIQKRYSGNTVNCYYSCLTVFFRYYSIRSSRISHSTTPYSEPDNAII